MCALTLQFVPIVKMIRAIGERGLDLAHELKQNLTEEYCAWGKVKGGCRGCSIPR